MECFDIVGLERSDNGRSCEAHDVCGLHVVVNDVVILKKTVVTVNGRSEAAVAVHRVTNGSLHCRIGFIARSQLSSVADGSLLKIVEFYKDSDLRQDRARSHRNAGMAIGLTLDNL